MAYAKDGFPVEQASKIGHLKLINNDLISRIVEDFESPEPSAHGPEISVSGTVDLSVDSPITRIITVDGGQAVVPNPARREKTLAFVQVAACLLRMDDLRYMREHPLMDPRDLKKMIDCDWYNAAPLPLSGIHLSGLSLKESIRRIVDRTLRATGLQETLKFLVYREWESEWTIAEEERLRMNCLGCGHKDMRLPRHQLSFSCSRCGYEHTLSDYLSIGAEDPEDWSREETASALRDALETLTLFHFLRKYFREDTVMEETLFVKDGPLLLRAALSRLVMPIRDFITHIRNEDHPLHFVGIEKTGDFANFLDEYREEIPETGDYFLPSVEFLVEEISGSNMSPGYRNRVSYGAKTGARLGQGHLVAMNVPTGQFLLDPQGEDLIGFEGSVRILSELVSHRYPNALIPLVMANSAASIARRPSGDILSTFTDQLMENRTRQSSPSF